ncbi:putative sister chromatid cohesion protein Pds5 [Helianthus debilis subsp. tardiflorus]
MAFRSSVFTLEIRMKLACLKANRYSASSLYEIEQLLSKVEESPSESINEAVHPIFELLIAKEWLRHPDIDVNILVACCICEILRIVGAQPFYNDEQMKEFFESVVMIFEKLISAPDGCGFEIDRFLEKFSTVRLPVMMLELQLDDLIVQLFRHILSISNDKLLRVRYVDLVHQMETIMTMFIEESKEINPELVDLLITSARQKKDNQTAIPLCWQLVEQVIKNCADKLKPHLPNMVHDKVAEETITCTTEAKELKNDTNHNSQVGCVEESKVLVMSKCGHSEDEKNYEKKTVSVFDDPPKSVTEVKKKRKRSNSSWKKQAPSVDHGENLVGSRIKVWCPLRKIYEKGVVKSFDCGLKKHKVLYDDGDEELVDLKGERWKLFENVSAIPDSVGNDSSHESGVICLQGYKVKQSYAPILEAIFNKHGDIAANCVFKTSSARTYFLEVVCEIVERIQTTDMIEIVEDIEGQLLDVEVANINVSWIRAHIEAFHKGNEARMVMKTKANLTLVKMPARRDLEMRYAKFLAARERFEKADKCMQVLHLVEKKLNDSILDTKGAKDLYVKQPLL